MTGFQLIWIPDTHCDYCFAPMVDYRDAPERGIAHPCKSEEAQAD
jgi:hypothetical protein